MDIQQVINDTNYSVRTQISLSPSLYKLIKETARREDKSLAQVVRDNLLTHFQEENNREKEKTARIMKLIERVRALRGKSGWSKVKNPRALIRKWHREEDEIIMKRLGIKT